MTPNDRDADTLAEQADAFGDAVRDLRDAVLLRPVARCLTAAGVETADIDDVSDEVSLLDRAAALLAGPVLAHLGLVAGLSLGLQAGLGEPAAVALGGGLAVLAGGAGLLWGYRELFGRTDRP